MNSNILNILKAVIKLAELDTKTKTLNTVSSFQKETAKKTMPTNEITNPGSITKKMTATVPKAVPNPISSLPNGVTNV